MVHPVRHHFEFADYIRVEQDSEIKHEYLGGQVWAMAGGSPDHSRIATNIARALGNQLEGKPCTVFNSDLRIRVQATGLATYPDVTVVCGSIELDPEDPTRHTVINPRVLIEVLSPSTEAYDRGEKLDHYRQLSTADTIVLVAQDQRRVEVWRRASGGWQAQSFDRGPIELATIACQLDVDQIYRDPLARS